MNVQFQRIVLKDKKEKQNKQTNKKNQKTLLSDQCKEMEENNRVGNTRDLFKKISNTKGIFHAKMCTIKDRHSMALTEAEDTKKRWQEYTEDLYRNDFHNPESHNGIITYLDSTS